MNHGRVPVARATIPNNINANCAHSANNKVLVDRKCGKY